MAKESIEHYKELLKKETAKKEEAAKFGLQLCEEVNILKERIELLTKKHLDELTIAEQERYSLNLKLSQKCQVEKSQASDLEHARDQLDKQAKELARWMAFEKDTLQKILDLKKEKEDLEEGLHDTYCKNKKMTERIAFLENQVIEAQALAENFAVNRSTEEEEQKLQLAVITLSNQTQDLEQQLEEASAELQVSKAKEERLQLLYQKLLEDIDIKNDQISSYSVLLQSTKEEKEELECEVERMKACDIDTNRRGNSLFAEVDDNRHVLRQELNILHLQYKSLEEKYNFSLKQEIKYKQQLAAMLSMTVETVSATYVHKLEQQLEETRAELKNALFKMKLANAKPSIPSPILQLHSSRGSSQSSNEEDYECLKLLLDQMRQKKEKAEKELEDERFLKVAEMEKLVESQRRTFVAEHSLQVATAEIARLKMKVQDKSNKGSRTRVVRVEKIPGFEGKDALSRALADDALLSENKENAEELESGATKHSAKKVVLSDDVKTIEYSSLPKEATAKKQEALVPTIVLSQQQSPSQCAHQ